MFFSFIVPVYNVENYLEICLESILVQTGAPFEILLLDDGSTDSSGDICDRYANDYPDIVRVIHKENEGSFFTRRRGFLEAKGDWFICVDSDDYIAPNLLKTLTDTIEVTGADMVMYNFSYFNEIGIQTPSRIHIADGSVFEGNEKQKLYEKRLLTVDFNSMCTRALKRELIDYGRDYRNCGVRNMCDDALQVLPIYTAAQKTVWLDRPMYFYRKWSGSTTARYTMERWDASRACFLHTETYLEKWNVSKTVRYRFYSKHLELLCNYLRWLFSISSEIPPVSAAELVKKLSQSPDYLVCRKHYRKEFAHSHYLALVVPILCRFVEHGNIEGIRMLLRVENILIRIKKR